MQKQNPTTLQWSTPDRFFHPLWVGFQEAIRVNESAIGTRKHGCCRKVAVTTSIGFVRKQNGIKIFSTHRILRHFLPFDNDRKFEGGIEGVFQ